MLNRLKRAWRVWRATKKLSVWTKDEFGRVFHYTFWLIPTSRTNRFLVRILRSGSSNSMEVVRTMTAPEVRELQQRAC
jgi:hypothetical protein